MSSPERINIAHVPAEKLAELTRDVERKHDPTTEQWHRINRMRQRIRDGAGDVASRVEAAYLRLVLHDFEFWRTATAPNVSHPKATRCEHAVGEGTSTVVCRGMIGWKRTRSGAVGRCDECGRDYARI